MKINNIKINSYGNLKNKEINLDNINIIYGKNESGKSTLLNFIKNMFYGISKNKNGNSISDYDKFYPWEPLSFSGKISYNLDNEQIFEVYRDFNRKDIQIYNEQMQDISPNFKIDKKLGNQFFIEQTGIDEDTFCATALIAQRRVKIDNNTQGNLIQKVANMLDSGEEEVSYKKVLQDLNSMLLAEVGSNTSKDRPINITQSNINKYNVEIANIFNIKQERFELEKIISELKKDVARQEQQDRLLDKAKFVLQNNKINEEKIKIKSNIYEENKNKIKYLDNNKDKLLEKANVLTEGRVTQKNSNEILSYFLIIFSIIINIANILWIENNITKYIIFSLIPISIINLLIKIRKDKKIENAKRKRVDSEHIEIEKQMEVIDGQVEILERNNEELKKEIIELKNAIEKHTNAEKQKLIDDNKSLKKDILEMFETNSNLIVDKSKKNLSDMKLELYKLEVDRDKINPELDKLINLEERLEIEKQNLEKLENRFLEFSITKELIEDAYREMKNNVAPKFNETLSKNIERISNGKYKNVSVNEGIIIENEDGRYISVENLSIGTIEQIYLSLRLSVMDELSKEKLPIFLDEAFAYYDDERLRAALKFLVECGHQIIICTCTNREKELLDLMNVNYNYILI